MTQAAILLPWCSFASPILAILDPISNSWRLAANTAAAWDKYGMTTRTTKIRAFVIGTLCLLSTLLLQTTPTPAQDALKIVAVVNEDVITELDLFMRMRLAMIS